MLNIIMAGRCSILLLAFEDMLSPKWSLNWTLQFLFPLRDLLVKTVEGETYIPSDFTVKPSEDFDPVYMVKLYDLGLQMARTGYPW